jgi:hypothetical protein
MLLQHIPLLAHAASAQSPARACCFSTFPCSRMLLQHIPLLAHAASAHSPARACCFSTHLCSRMLIQRMPCSCMPRLRVPRRSGRRDGAHARVGWQVRPGPLPARCRAACRGLAPAARRRLGADTAGPSRSGAITKRCDYPEPQAAPRSADSERRRRLLAP